jgi:hypothetical protein
MVADCYLVADVCQFSPQKKFEAKDPDYPQCLCNYYRVSATITVSLQLLPCLYNYYRVSATITDSSPDQVIIKRLATTAVLDVCPT